MRVKRKSVTKRATIRKKKSVRKRTSVPKTRNNNTWSESAFWQFIRSSLRQKSRWWKPRLLCLQNARRPNQSKNKRLKWEFQCSHCEKWHQQKFVEVNHKIPVGTLMCAADLPAFVENLFCEVDNLEVVCKQCHSIHHKKT